MRDGIENQNAANNTVGAGETGKIMDRTTLASAVSLMLKSALVPIGGSMAATVDGADCETAGAARTGLRYSSRKPTLIVTW